MKYKLKLLVRIFFSAPGVMVHEFSHVVFCLLMGIKVHKVCYFRIGNPAGFVEHNKPRSFIQAFFISVGPFIFGTVIALLFFWLSIYSTKELLRQSPGLWITFEAIVSLWFGLAIAINCFPSDGDAEVLLSETNHHVLQKFNPFAIIIYPFILIIKVANYLKRFYFDWIYGIFLLGIATYVVIL